MKSVIYYNIIGFVLFVILPWYISDKEYYWNILPFDANYLFYFALLAAAFLVYLNIKKSTQTKGGAKKAAIVFVIPPALVILYFILGYFAFGGFTGF